MYYNTVIRRCGSTGTVENVRWRLFVTVYGIGPMRRFSIMNIPKFLSGGQK